MENKTYSAKVQVNPVVSTETGRAYKSVDHHVCESVRHFLKRRHKVPNRGTQRFSSKVIYGDLELLALDYRRGPHDETSRKAGCGKLACPV
jgi:hypothetical protein